MENHHRQLLFLTTALLDIALLYILANQPLKNYERVFILSVLIIHLYFFVCLTVTPDGGRGLDFCHYGLALSLVFSIFLSNKSIIGLCLLVILFIQFLWLKYGKCILNADGKTLFGPYSRSTVTITQIITVILLFKITFLHNYY